MIETAQGSVAVEALKPGDMVWTRDHGLQPLRWIGGKTLNREQLAEQPELAPVRIKAGALGRGQPLRDMMVSPQHRVLIAGSRAELLFGEDELLVAAIHLVGQPGITRVEGRPVRYVHLMFDRHEIVLSDGLWTESFQPGDRTLAGMDAGQRAELDALFPGITTGRLFPAARRALKSHEVRVLFAA
ncbi:Hint domain-containing protein [Tabrizicola sp. J26]|nr:Hint domain-containing protein [Tabrizicola rongguiensis]